MEFGKHLSKGIRTKKRNIITALDDPLYSLFFFLNNNNKKEQCIIVGRFFFQMEAERNHP